MTREEATLSVMESQADQSGWLLRVTDLKQFAYCPRVVYYDYCMPLLRPVTYKMTAGVEAHEDAARAEVRRSLRPFGLQEGQRHFNVALESQRLGLSGRIDLVIIMTDGQAVPVDYKLSRHKPAGHYRLQLAAYAELLEENWQMPVKTGFIYLLPLRQAEAVPISKRLRAQLAGQLADLREMIAGERMPAATTQRARCVNCEFRRFCNDVL